MIHISCLQTTNWSCQPSTCHVDWSRDPSRLKETSIGLWFLRNHLLVAKHRWVLPLIALKTHHRQDPSLCLQSNQTKELANHRLFSGSFETISYQISKRRRLVLRLITWRTKHSSKKKKPRSTYFIKVNRKENKRFSNSINLFHLCASTKQKNCFISCFL